MSGLAAVRLREATLRDSRSWWDIRNDPKVRSWSRTAHCISPTEHGRWWRQAILNPKRKLYMVDVAGRNGEAAVVGIARLDHRGGWTELSLAVMPSAQGRGVGSAIVRLLLERVEALRWPEAGAVVNGKNARSLRIFTKMGFVMKRRGWIELRYPVTPRMGVRR